MVANDPMSNDPARNDMLILVDGLDRQVGTATKEQTLAQGLLHRAFSVVLVRKGADGPELLLAQRALDKYHSGGLWANTCCSHPREGEGVLDAAQRRVREELGCEAIDLHELTAFAYRAEFETGFCEYEYDHVLVGRCEGELAPDPAEVAAVRWVGIDALAAERVEKPRRFAAWAPMVLTMVLAEMPMRGVLEDARAEIDRADQDLAAAFERRMAAVAKIAACKIQQGLSIYDAAREAEVVERGKMCVSEGVRPYYLRVLDKLMEESRSYQQQLMDGEGCAVDDEAMNR